MDLFHGTRTPFDHFLPQYYRTGEGFGNFTGWYFCDTLRGALVHCESYLRCNVRAGEGYILHCKIGEQWIKHHVDAEYADPIYGSPIYGVPLSASAEIMVLDRLPARQVLEQLYGPIG